MMADARGAGGDAIAAAQARLLTDPSFQFAFAPAPSPPRPPLWLTAFIRLLVHILTTLSPEVRVAFWVIIALAVGAILFVAARRWRGSARRKAKDAPLNLHALGAAASQAAAQAAARLAEADRLAALEFYAQAAHVLLLRGVADVEAGRPGAVRASSTSRDIAALPDLPPQPRAAFKTIAAVVERALFGGRPVDAAAWRTCRDAYGALVKPEAWLPA